MNDETAEVIEEVVDEIDESVDSDEKWLENRNRQLAGDDEDDEPEVTESEEKAEVEEKPEPSESSPEKKDDGFQKRIDELTQRYYNEKTQREHFQQQWEDSQTPEVPTEPGKTLADFDYDEAQFASYIQGQAVADAKAEIEQNAHQQAQFKRQADFKAKEDSFAKTVDDYHKVAHYSPISQEVAGVVMSAEKGPELAYYLGKNPELAASLSSMNILDAAREIGRIEATKLVKPEPSPSKVPNVPPKVKAGESSTVRVKATDKESDKLSDAEWLRRRNKQVNAR